jgi:UDP-N-acetylmuramate dehydrogenase
MLIESNASLKQWNSFGVSAQARRLVSLDQTADLEAALEILGQDPRRLILGGGSNVLFAGDFEGTVLKIGIRGRALVEQVDSTTALVEAQAGEPWDAFVRWTLGLGLYGLENLSLIPGTVGASPMQNIGAYGVELRDRFESLRAVDLRTGAERVFSIEDCRFSYRDSVFRASSSPWLILSVRFRLSRIPKVQIDYPDLRARLDGALARPEDVANAVIEIRRSKLPDPARLGNAGSFFRNPVVAAEATELLLTKHPELPHYPSGQAGFRKLAAGWLIEQCGWKGHRRGDAGVHDRHALVLVNHGQASGQAVWALAQDIQVSVFERFGVIIEPEPKVVGAI